MEEPEENEGTERNKNVPKKIKSEAELIEEIKDKKRKSEFNNTTRWLPDTAFMTYCGKPPFHTYGKGNTNPAYGGILYGSYMLSHNINAESGDQAPLYQGTYDNAIRGAKERTPYRMSAIPKTKQRDARLEEERMLKDQKT
jgi:hypothetical protein